VFLFTANYRHFSGTRHSGSVKRFIFVVFMLSLLLHLRSKKHLKKFNQIFFVFNFSILLYFLMIFFLLLDLRSKNIKKCNQIFLVLIFICFFIFLMFFILLLHLRSKKHLKNSIRFFWF